MVSVNISAVGRVFYLPYMHHHGMGWSTCLMAMIQDFEAEGRMTMLEFRYKDHRWDDMGIKEEAGATFDVKLRQYSEHCHTNRHCRHLLKGMFLYGREWGFFCGEKKVDRTDEMPGASGKSGFSA